MKNNLRNLKGSSKWVFAPLLAGGLFSIFGMFAKNYVFGKDGKGGDILKLKTQYSMDEI
jgi:hypothetical protein